MWCWEQGSRERQFAVMKGDLQELMENCGIQTEDSEREMLDTCDAVFDMG